MLLCKCYYVNMVTAIFICVCYSDAFDVLLNFFLCLSSVSLGWPSPSAPWPSGSGRALSICLLLPGSGGTGAMEDHHPHTHAYTHTPLKPPLHRTPPPAPRPAAQAPDSAQRCQVGPRTCSWTPPRTHAHTAHNSNTYAR